MMYTWNDGTDYLMHHGIKGQKWGIRRFQNLDGTLTLAGKEHYGRLSAEDKAKYKSDLSKNIKRAAGSAIASGAGAAIGERIGYISGTKTASKMSTTLLRHLTKNPESTVSFFNTLKPLEYDVMSFKPESFEYAWRAVAIGEEYLKRRTMAGAAVAALPPAAIAVGSVIAASYAGYKLISDKRKEKRNAQI